MANAAQEEQLLDIRVAEASAAYKFYLNQEAKILGTISVVALPDCLGADRKHLSAHQSDVYERAVAHRQGCLAAIRVRGNLERSLC